MDTKSLILIIVIVIIIICSIVGYFNNLIRLKKNIERAISVIDVYLKKRYDLIPNLVEVTKEYTKYESDTLEKIVNLRTKFNENNDSDASSELHKYYKNLIMLVEKYPELKASDSYLNLQKQLSKIESEIQASRRLYINSITEYNNKVKQIPSNLFALILGYKEIEYPKYEIYDFEMKF